MSQLPLRAFDPGCSTVDGVFEDSKNSCRIAARDGPQIVSEARADLAREHVSSKGVGSGAIEQIQFQSIDLSLANQLAQPTRNPGRRRGCDERGMVAPHEMVDHCCRRVIEHVDVVDPEHELLFTAALTQAVDRESEKLRRSQFLERETLEF